MIYLKFKECFNITLSIYLISVREFEYRLELRLVELEQRRGSDGEEQFDLEDSNGNLCLIEVEISTNLERVICCLNTCEQSGT